LTDALTKIEGSVDEPSETPASPPTKLNFNLDAKDKSMVTSAVNFYADFIG
tara:strand:- start:550 stop:702 length:153 start_codon:yes stop_codon:yes gene_type:complete